MSEQVNEIRMKILEDGVISVDTGRFTPEVHLEADELVKTTFEALGGERKVLQHKPHGHHHAHTHVEQQVKNG